MKNIQQELTDASHQLKQLKDSLKPFKKDKKTLESEVNDVEKQYKQLKTKHQNVFKILENKCTYWIMVDELLLKIRLKHNYLSNLILIKPNSDTLVDKHLEAVSKHLKVNIFNLLFLFYFRRFIISHFQYVIYLAVIINYHI